MRLFKFLSILLSLCCGYAVCKECTNIPTELSSHTVRYELLTSNNDTRKQEMFSHYHMTPTDDSTWSNLLPRKILKVEDEHKWSMMYRKLKSSDLFNQQEGFLKEVSLQDVRLDPGSKHGRAQQTNLKYLLMLDVDSLVWSFRKTAGLPTPGEPYKGWEDPNCELRGHFVGHYMSASAQMWASTNNRILQKKMSAVVSALSECQNKMGTGYLSAFPSEQFDRFEAIKPVWAPYYTIHKILAGLLDQHTLANNKQALNMAIWMVEYFYNRVQNVMAKYSIERHWLSLNEETGGMNDVLYRLYTVTKNPKHLFLAHLFDKPCFLGVLAMKADDISGYHANTHIPVVVGSQMRYEITGESLYKEIGTFFMDIVNSSHAYPTGGTSVDEFWRDPKRLASTLKTENEESCTTYNMLKVSRHLFRWTKEMAYADYYERALTNGVLSIQRGTEPGVMIYMLPHGRGVSKGRSYHSWGTQFETFWCCYGTGIESFSKLGDSIYFEEAGNVPGLYVIQHISSLLNWKSGNILLKQKVEPAVSWDSHLRVTFTILSKKKGPDVASTLHLRIPFWTHSSGAKAVLNGQDLSLPPPGNFLSIPPRNWSPGDKLTLELPMGLRTETIKDDRPEYASLQAIFYGPYLLAGLTSGDWDIKKGSSLSFSNWITPIPAAYHSHLISLSQQLTNSKTVVLTNSNFSITMDELPMTGTDSSIDATFRIILKDTAPSEFSKPEEIIGKSVMLEPFDFPGMVLTHQGIGKGLTIAESVDENSIFRFVSGLDGNGETISLESASQKGCFVHGSSNIRLKCKSGSSDSEFNKAASFTLRDGISKYHPISFVAKGMKRNFLLAPLLSLMDESYTVFFNIQP
ncbi:hypothetical protein NMG60_11033607 [Bertholletia excelsa]